MKGKLIFTLLACYCAIAGAAHAQVMDQEMSGLAGKLNKALVAKGFKNVANLDFTDIQGQATELGRFLSDQLAVEIVSTGGVSMVDRANLKSILAEHKLTEEGLVNPANAKKLGEFAGVDAILIGNVTALDDGIVLMVKAISTESATIVAAGRIKFAKTSDIQQLLNRGISPNALPSTSAAAVPSGAAGTSYQEAKAIATKDIGSLRVVLKTVMSGKTKDAYGIAWESIKCSLSFTNRETQRSMLLAANAEPKPHEMGALVRASLNDDQGGVWRLSTNDVRGMGIVAAGASSWNKAHDATEIVSLLVQRDERNSDVNRDDGRLKFIYGAMSSISPGQSVDVTMSFLRKGTQRASGPAPQFFQIDSEIVVGIVGADNKKTYSLQNLMFDRVGMPKL